MLFVMGVTLYTSRVVLQALGVVDYGIYNVVGGLSSTFVFFSSALSNATQRFLNYEHGKGRTDKLNNIFNLSILVYCSIAIVIILIGVIFGTWFVDNKLIIPDSSLPSARMVLYMTLLSLLFSFVGSVYESVLISRENMKIYAYVGIIDAIGRLICAYLITIIPNNKLSIYAILLAIVHILPKLLLIIYCAIQYSETRIKYYWDKKIFREMFTFAGWNIYGTGVWMVNQQGVNIILNIFFGPIVNAARGIATQITTAVTNVGINFFTAVRPQLIKSYASEEINSFINLIYKSSKYSVFLLLYICLPLFLKTEYILSLWLKDVPDYTVIFTKWVLVFVLIDSLNNPLWCAIQAIGDLKKTILFGSSFYLLAFPVSYLSLRFGAPSWIVYPIIILFRIIYLTIVFKILKLYIPISSIKYAKKVLFPTTNVIIISYIISYLLDLFEPTSITYICALLTTTTTIISFIIFIFGLSSDERRYLTSKFKGFTHRK